MLARLISYFWPSRRQAFHRILGWGAGALFFFLWALCGHEASIAAIALYLPLPIALYNVLIWWLRGYFDRRALAWAYQEAEHDYAPAPTSKQTPGRRTLRVPPKLD